MESDVNYYRRRAFAEMAAAGRAVTEAARDRRLYLVDLYVQRLEALKAPNPFTDQDFGRVKDPLPRRSAFAWRGR